MCLRDLPAAMQPDATTLRSDLLAGRLDAAATPPLTRVETVISLNMADVNFPHFQMGFPVFGGDTVGWSTRETPAGPEVLKMQAVGNDASRVTVASGINSWSGSPDGTRWYWFSAVNETSGAGTLQSAPYPAGTGPVNIATNIRQYDFPTPTSLLTVDSARQMRIVADPVGVDPRLRPVTRKIDIALLRRILATVERLPTTKPDVVCIDEIGPRGLTAVRPAASPSP